MPNRICAKYNLCSRNHAENTVTNIRRVIKYEENSTNCIRPGTCPAAGVYQTSFVEDSFQHSAF